jgi:hypothetical protein
VTEKIQRWRGILALIAGVLAFATTLANFVHSGKVYWAGPVIMVLALVVWRSSRKAGTT